LTSNLFTEKDDFIKELQEL
jgi:dynein heavy chain